MAAVGQGKGKMEVEDRRQRKGGEVGGGERRWEG